MKKTNILAAIISTSVMAFGVACSHEDKGPNNPSAITGQANPAPEAAPQQDMDQNKMAPAAPTATPDQTTPTNPSQTESLSPNSARQPTDQQQQNNSLPPTNPAPESPSNGSNGSNGMSK